MILDCSMRAFRVATTCLFLTSGVIAKEKPKIAIRVVSAEIVQQEYVATTAAVAGTSSTGCRTSKTLGDAIATGIPVGTTQCETESTPGKPAEKVLQSLPETHVRVILPNADDGKKVILWCRKDILSRCEVPAAGVFRAEVSGNTVWIYVPDLEGKEHKIRYDYLGTWQ